VEYIFFYAIGLIGLVAAFTTSFWFTVLFWIECQFMYLQEEDYGSEEVSEV